MKNKITIIPVLVAIVTCIILAVFDTPALPSQTQNVNEDPLTVERAMFGSVKTSTETPVIQIQFPYNINSDIMDIRLNRGGTATVSNGMLQLSTSTDPFSVAWGLSRDTIQYRPGEGVSVKGAIVFGPCESGHVKLWGVGEVGDGLALGCSGANFGVFRNFGGKPEVQSLNITSGATSSGTITITLDGDVKEIEVLSSDTEAEIATKIRTAIWDEVGAGWTPFNSGTATIFKSWGDGDKTGSFAFVDTDTTGVIGSFSTLANGVTTTRLQTLQGDFTHDDLSWLDLSKGNVFRIRYQWLGFGNILYEVEKPQTGQFKIFHREGYVNKNIQPSMFNPTLPLSLLVINAGGTSTVTVKVSSMAASVEGPNLAHPISNSGTSLAASINTTEEPLLTICNKVVYGSISPANLINRINVRPNLLSMLTDGAQNVVFTVSRNSELLGSPLFDDINTQNSVVGIDVAATGVVLGEIVARYGLGKVDAETESLAKEDSFLKPGDTLTISAHSVSGTNAEVKCTLTWNENF